MSFIFRYGVSANKVLSAVIVANRHLRDAQQSLSSSPKALLGQLAVVRRGVGTASSKHERERGESSRQIHRMKPRKPGEERLVMKEMASKRSGKIAGLNEKRPDTGLVKQSQRVVTADDLREFPFLSLGVSRQLSVRLNDNFGIQTPVEIQSLSIKPILSNRNLVIHSETGSGKTLAYLLPVVQQAKYRCHTIIVVPTRELAYQIYIEARKLAPKKDLACYVSRPGVETEFQKLKEKPPKIIIGTPKILLSIIRDHEFLFSNVRRVVADEVDKMLPPIPSGMRNQIKKRERFPKPLTLLLAVIEGIAKRPVQYIACSATINDQMVENLKDLQWGQRMRLITSDKCSQTSGAVPSAIKHNYVFIPDFSIDSKAAALSKIFLQMGKKPILVFVHGDHSSNEYVKELTDLNINAVAFYRQVISGAVNDIQKFLDDFRTGKISVVVASEEEVRGLDFKDLQHVFIFSVPKTADDYLHLAGRVGRLGKEGMVTTVLVELHDSGLKRLLDIYKRLGISGNEIDPL